MSIPTFYKNVVPNVSEQLFDTFFNESSRDKYAASSSLSYDVYSDKKSFYLDIDVAGVAKENVKIDVENNVLKVSVDFPERQKESNYIVKKRPEGSISESFKISRDLDSEKISANFENGLLRVAVPIKEAVAGRTIEIQW